jgi:hypothetical protein
MKPGEVVMTTSIEVRTAIAKPSMRANFKSNPGTAMVFIACGSVKEGDSPTRQAERVLEAKGWVSPSMVEGRDDGIEQAFFAADSQHKG